MAPFLAVERAPADHRRQPAHHKRRDFKRRKRRPTGLGAEKFSYLLEEEEEEDETNCLRRSGPPRAGRLLPASGAQQDMSLNDDENASSNCEQKLLGNQFRRQTGVGVGGTRPGWARFVSAFIFICLASANRTLIITSTQTQPVPAAAGDTMAPGGHFERGSEAQSLLAYNLLKEFGSGNGAPSQRNEGAGPVLPFDLSSSVSPSLIEARCWNNYENDQDCKQLNVITAPNGDELLRPKQQQQQQPVSSSPADDSIITPVVIFEASSSVEPAPSGEQEQQQGRQLFMGQPPYQAAGEQRRRPITANDQFAAPPQTATILPVHFERPATRTSAKNSVIYVATPQPTGRKSTPIKTTTAGRKCRDENDADCDEPEDETADGSRAKSGVGAGGGGGDERDENERRGSAAAVSTDESGDAALGVVEEGSGGYAPSDDNDDSTDDGDDGDEGGRSSEGDDSGDGDEPNSIDQSSGNTDEAESTPQLLEVTSVYPGQTGDSGATDDIDNRITTPSSHRVYSPKLNQNEDDSGATQQSARAQTGAEIEVVVHSTLPPSFPSSAPGSGGRLFTSPSSTSSSTSTTMMPDETFTSKPIFPPSTEASANSEADEGEAGADNGRAGQPDSTTQEIDLYTFKPIPIPVDKGPSRFEQRQQQQQQQNGLEQAGLPAGEQQQQPEEVNSQNIHEPANNRRPMAYDGRNTFDDGWTTRRPMSAHSQQGAAQSNAREQADSLALGNKRLLSGASKAHIGTDMLPTLLLYASIIILVATALIVSIMFYVFWRRNAIRRRNMLAKAHLLNGPQPPHAGHMIQSMSHASQLHGGGGGDPSAGSAPGLLSTYMPGKGMGAGKVTSSIVQPAPGGANRGGNARLLPGTLDEEEEEEEEEKGDETNGSEQASLQKSGSKEQLVALGDQAAGQRREQQHTRGARAPRLNSSDHPNQTSWSTDEPTTSSGTGNSSSQTQDNQQEGVVGQPLGTPATNGLGQQAGPSANSRTGHYPNSLSDGRQNSSSLSDSQGSPEASLVPQHPAAQIHQPMMLPAKGADPSMGQRRPPMGPQAGGGGGGRHQASATAHMLHQPAIGNFRPRMPTNRHPDAYPNPSALAGGGGGGPMIGGSPLHFRPPYGPPPPGLMMLAQNGHGQKAPLIAASRSIEDLQLSASSSHVGFVLQQPQQQHHQASNHVMLPQLVHPGRPGGQLFGSPRHQAYPPIQQQQQQQNMVPFDQQVISPQRIAMNPLATLSRRYPPGAGLNRNIYSEESSSFITTSPSLARTSSSSSFALNLAKHQPDSPPSMGSINSIKAKPMVDPSSGRVINDYTAQAQFNGNGSMGPPVFERPDRGEAWYV